ncbi:hypothetical protein ANRL3_01353 [Anaerolineae bacterium]|nr:hypothetical protein ANRL3_01353 [Anaerolineae bacterium]
MKSLVQIETHTSAPITLGNQQIILQSRAVSINLPVIGGIVWNRPSAVITRTDAGRTQMLAVCDVTRLAQLLIVALGIAGVWLIALTWRQRD